MKLKEHFYILQYMFVLHQKNRILSAFLDMSPHGLFKAPPWNETKSLTGPVAAVELLLATFSLPYPLAESSCCH